MKAIRKWEWLIKTKRLYLKLNWQSGRNCLYFIYRKETHNKVGEISYLQNGEIVYEFFEPYRGADYEVEVVSVFASYLPQKPRPYLRIRKTDEFSKCVAERSNFLFFRSEEEGRFDIWLYSS